MARMYDPLALSAASSQGPFAAEEKEKKSPFLDPTLLMSLELFTPPEFAKYMPQAATFQSPDLGFALPGMGGLPSGAGLPSSGGGGLGGALQNLISGLSAAEQIGSLGGSIGKGLSKLSEAIAPTAGGVPIDLSTTLPSPAFPGETMQSISAPEILRGVYEPPAVFPNVENYVTYWDPGTEALTSAPAGTTVISGPAGAAIAADVAPTTEGQLANYLADFLPADVAPTTLPALATTAPIGATEAGTAMWPTFSELGLEAPALGPLSEGAGLAAGGFALPAAAATFIAKGIFDTLNAGNVSAAKRADTDRQYQAKLTEHGGTQAGLAEKIRREQAAGHPEWAGMELAAWGYFNELSRQRGGYYGYEGPARWVSGAYPDLDALVEAIRPPNRDIFQTSPSGDPAYLEWLAQR